MLSNVQLAGTLAVVEVIVVVGDVNSRSCTTNDDVVADVSASGDLDARFSRCSGVEDDVALHQVGTQVPVVVEQDARSIHVVAHVVADDVVVGSELDLETAAIRTASAGGSTAAKASVVAIVVLNQRITHGTRRGSGTRALATSVKTLTGAGGFVDFVVSEGDVDVVGSRRVGRKGVLIEIVYFQVLDNNVTCRVHQAKGNGASRGRISDDFEALEHPIRASKLQDVGVGVATSEGDRVSGESLHDDGVFQRSGPSVGTTERCEVVGSRTARSARVEVDNITSRQREARQVRSKRRIARIEIVDGSEGGIANHSDAHQKQRQLQPRSHFLNEEHTSHQGIRERALKW